MYVDRLPEWLAFHYFALPLRYLVVATDPESKTSPTPIFDKWRSRTNLTVIEWTIRDFLSERDQELVISKDPVLLERDNNFTAAARAYQIMQTNFYTRCTRHLQSQSRTWTAYIDIDEYVSINSDAISDSWTPFSFPGSILRLSQILSDETRERSSDVPAAWYQLFRNSSCVTLPRALISAVNSSKAKIERDVPKFINPEDFDTLRFRYRATSRFSSRKSYSINNWGKSIIDLKRVKPEHFLTEEEFPIAMGSEGIAHRPLPKICPRRRVFPHFEELPLGIFHYLGSWESYSCRDDARETVNASLPSFTHNFDKWKVRSVMHDGEEDDQMRPWIGGFVRVVGENNARYLLEGAGQLSGCKNNATAVAVLAE